MVVNINIAVMADVKLCKSTCCKKENRFYDVGYIACVESCFFWSKLYVSHEREFGTELYVRRCMFVRGPMPVAGTRSQ